jgi:hypothetical protein
VNVNSEKTALSVLNLYKNIPQLSNSGFIHFEEIQLLVENIAEDRVSDLTCSFLKSFLIDYTIEQCEKLRIPLAEVDLTNVYDYRKKAFINDKVALPHHPETLAPMLFVPKRWLRFTPWINYEDYYKNHFIKQYLRHLCSRKWLKNGMNHTQAGNLLKNLGQ